MSEQAGPDRTRRLIIKGAVVGGLAGFGLVGGGLMRVQAADASKWPKDAFAQKTEADAIKAIYGKSAEESDKVRLDAPEIAEALVEAGGKLYSATKEVKVTVGGCGG